MLESIVKSSIKQRLVVLLGVVTLLALGISSYLHLPIEAFPDVLNQTVQVITQFPGQSADEIERKITIPLEREFTGIPRVAQSRSVSEFGLSVIYLYFEDGVDRYWARSQTIEKIGTVEIPPGVQPSLAPLASVTGEVLRYEVKGSGFNTTQLRTVQDWILEKQFRMVPGVADVISYGGKVRTWAVIIDPSKLAYYGISPKQIAEAVTASNQNAGGDLINWPNQSFVVRSQGQYLSLDDLGHVGIVKKGNTLIRVKDVATVTESFAPQKGIVGRDDKDDIVQGIVLLRKGENPVEVGRAIEKKVHELKTTSLLPAGVSLQVYYNRLELVTRTTSTVGKNLLEGFLLVLVVLFFFLRSWPATLLVSSVVPLSLCFAFCIILATGTPANLISLGAIDFGIMVDGAVIIVEYLLEYYSEKRAVFASIQDKIIEVVKPVFVSMVIVIVAYLPIFTLQSVEGKMFSPLAFTISFALIGALLLSLTLIPTLMPAVIRHTMAHPHVDPEWLIKTKNGYLHLMDQLLESPRRVTFIFGPVLGLGIFVAMISGSEFIPELDEGALWIRASYPHSLNFKEGVKLSHQIRKVLRENEEVKTVVSQLGGPEDGQDPNLFDNCEFFVDIKPRPEWKRFGKDREHFAEHIRQQLKQFPGVFFNVSQPIADNVEEAVSGVKGKNAVKIYGADLKTLDEISEKLVKLIRSVPGTVDVARAAVMPKIPHLTIKVDRQKISQFGLTAQDVNDLIELSVGGKNLTFVFDGEIKIDVYIRAQTNFRSRVEDIQALPLALAGGARIRLDQIAKVTMEEAPQAIYRENGFRRIAVKFNIQGRDLGSTMKEILAAAKDFQTPPGYFLKWDGEYQNQKRATARLQIVLPSTVLIIGIILFILFSDLSLVGLILFTLLAAVSGSIILLYLRDIPISVSAAVGLLTLFGLVALDDITLASSLVRDPEKLKLGNLKAHILETCGKRFRPVFMNSILAALGLLPAALSHGVGSETQRPLATAVIGGILTGVPAVLLMFPVAFYLLTKFRLEKKLTN